ncbi:MAG TPA: LptE family protein [Bacteroidaceae bacterium]|nr:LptE family protein [Bacteroidaceae bacterium]
MRSKSIWNLLIVGFFPFMLISCTVSYKFNRASIDYNVVKTITIESFTNRASYQWGPMASIFSNALSDIYVRQTKLKQVKTNGNLHLSGEITSYDQTNKSISSDGYSSMVQLKMSVRVVFVNNTNHSEDFERTFSATREYESSQQFSVVQEELVTQMTNEIVDQIFNATVANW